jgi:PiT family inorganic phosphate transporter
MSPIIICVVVLALIFNFLNGIHDSSNIVATMISSRALSPRVALTMLQSYWQRYVVLSCGIC